MYQVKCCLPIEVTTGGVYNVLCGGESNSFFVAMLSYKIDSVDPIPPADVENPL